MNKDNFTYDCQGDNHQGNAINVPDENYPDKCFTAAGLNPEICINCHIELLRSEIRAERISYEEIVQLQNLAEYISPDDTELLEWAGVKEDV